MNLLNPNFVKNQSLSKKPFADRGIADRSTWLDCKITSNVNLDLLLFIFWQYSGVLIMSITKCLPGFFRFFSKIPLENEK